MSKNFEILRQAGEEVELFRTPQPLLTGRVQAIPRALDEESEVEVFAVPPARATRIAVFLVIVLTGIGISFYIYQRHIPLSHPQQVLALEGTAFQGVIKPACEVKVAASISGVVARVMTKLGDRVEEGQPLMVMENHELEAEVTESRIEQEATAQQIAQLERSLSGPGQSPVTQLAEANSRVSVLERRAQQIPTPERRESPERARAAYERALAAFRRMEVLQQEGLASQQQFEDARATLRIAEDDQNVALKAEAAEEALAKEQESQARLQVEVTRRQQFEQLQELRSRYQKAAQALKVAQQRLSDATVKATSEGVVVELPVKAGDQVAAGTMLARVARLDVLVAKVEVGARVVNALHLKQRALVTLPSVPPQNVEGMVTTISPVPTEDMNHIIEVEFRNDLGTLWSDQPAEVHFLGPPLHGKRRYQ
jgi:multidrug efflux pump subunit AcrA (membrane-fusion protein)